MSSASTDHTSTPPALNTAPPARTLAPNGHRVAAAITAAACLTLLGVAAYLQPASDGHGTHEQLGLYPCVWAKSLDFPCPTCGMTTSFAHAAEGQFQAAFLTQPFGALLAIITAITFWLAAHQAIFASRVGRMTDALTSGRTLWIGAAMLASAWIYKIIIW